ncbi:hypothetical protein JZO83_10925 [Enterococcus sp. DIV1298c]|nr:hypothetical protein [Enterococcus sp. DIV1298c]MBO0462271.1 hypothetical protein [Enterococcus sp. DIV1298c]
MRQVYFKTSCVKGMADLYWLTKDALQSRQLTQENLEWVNDSIDQGSYDG